MYEFWLAAFLLSLSVQGNGGEPALQELSSYQGELFYQDQLEVLLKEGIWERFYSRFEEVSLPTQVGCLPRLFSEATKKEHNNVLEALYFLSTKTTLADYQLFNILNKISSLSEVVSQEEGMVESPLFPKIYRTRTPRSWVPQMDTQFPPGAIIPVESHAFVFLEDRDLGEYRLRLHYHYQKERRRFCLNLINLTDINYGPILAIEKEKLHMYLLVQPVEEGFLFYGIVHTAVSAFVPKSYQQKLLKTRLMGLYHWAKAQIIQEQ